MKKNMTIDIICPLYDAENYIENLNKSIIKQKKVEINSIKYVLTKGKDNTESLLKKLKCEYTIISAFRILSFIHQRNDGKKVYRGYNSIHFSGY